MATSRAHFHGKAAPPNRRGCWTAAGWPWKSPVHQCKLVEIKLNSFYHRHKLGLLKHNFILHPSRTFSRFYVSGGEGGERGGRSVCVCTVIGMSSMTNQFGSGLCCSLLLPPSSLFLRLWNFSLSSCLTPSQGSLSILRYSLRPCPLLVLWKMWYEGRIAAGSRPSGTMSE